MKMKIKYLLLTVLLVYSSLPTNANDAIKQGLYFHSFEVDKDKRTCLDLTPERPLVFDDGFAMEFDLKLRPINHIFGYVVRIICNDTLNVDLLADITSGQATFSLVIKNRILIQYKTTKQEYSSIENTWIKIWFDIEPDNNRISLSLNGVKKDTTYLLTDLNRFNMYFGGNKRDKFSTTDIIPMSVKDIRFFDGKKKLVRYWKLAKHSSDNVYDECISDRATVLNPVWEIDRYANWEERASLAFPGQYYQIAFDRDGGRFFFVKDKMIFTYDMKTYKPDTLEVLDGVCFNIFQSNQFVYDSNRKVLMSYDFVNKRLVTFDLYTRKWNNYDDSPKVQQYIHHNQLFIPEDSLLVTFGGYGYHRYNSMFFKCHVVKDIWDITDLSQSISPRYLGGMGRLDDRHLLYFGGFGNESGAQEEFPRNFYALYTINIENNAVEKIWELSNPNEHFTNSNSLVIDKNNGTFYALAYPNKRYASFIKLHKYSLNKPEYHIVGDSIPYFFNDVESYCNLYHSADSSELYAITMYVRDNNSEINIYSMAFPPLSLEEITQHPSSRSNIWFLITVLLIGLAGVFLVYLYFYRKRKNVSTITGNVRNEQIDDHEDEPIVNDNIVLEKKPSSIGLLGNFCIVDSSGNEITKNFTLTTNQLFLLILMSTLKNGNGITSAELRKTMWYDKNDESARNYQNVYVNKLRSILKSFKEVRVVYTEGDWSIQFEKTVFCDYIRALSLICTLQTDKRFDPNLLIELVDIALKGTLLPFTEQTEWLEPYQTDFADRLIECLKECSKYNELKTNLTLLLKMANVILLYDNIDEDAIQFKCYALFWLGRRNQALQVFNKFTADYESLLATKHHLVFEELVKQT